MLRRHAFIVESHLLVTDDLAFLLVKLTSAM